MIEFTSYDPHVVLAVGAHPDDIDFGAAGSLATWVKQGAEVHYLIVTDGSKGSADPHVSVAELIAIRQAEQRAAAALLGAHEVHFLGYEDAAVELTMALKKDIVRVIRQLRPDTVVVMDPTMVYVPELNYINHPDHRAIGQATLDAVFPLARDCLSFPELCTDENLEPHKVAHILLINLAQQNYFVNISDCFDTKLAALQKHESQFDNFEMLSDMLRSFSSNLGRKTGSKYAEGFMRIDTQA